MPKTQTCIINFAKGGAYPRGQDRLFQSLLDSKFFNFGDVFLFRDEAQLRCPEHRQIPYAFKVAAFNYAADLGYKIILWCDAAVWAYKPLDQVFKHIELEGHIFFYDGWNCAQWTSDACLAQMKVTRDQAEKMPMLTTCCMGLNLDNPRSAEFLRQLNRYAWDGVSFPGDWTNDRQQVSKDPRCLGHRHEQSVSSILSVRLGMSQLVANETFFAYYRPKDGSIYRYGQENDMTGINDSIVLLSQHPV